MGLTDIACDGCSQKLPLDASVSNGAPKSGSVRNIGGTFNGIFICTTCWNNAVSAGFNLDSKEDAKRWKSNAVSLNNQQDKQEIACKTKVQCDGCDQEFILDSLALNGRPKIGYVRNVGGTFHSVFVCSDCWDSASDGGFNLESKEDAKCWKLEKKDLNNRKNKLRKASEQMQETLPPEMERFVGDILLPHEKIIYKLRSSPSGDRSQAILTNLNLIIINKGLLGGQGQDSNGIIGTMMAVGRISIRVYPIQEIRSVEIQPLQGMTVGHLQVLTNATMENDNESKFLFDTDLGYYKSILMYRKIRGLQGFGVPKKQPVRTA